MKHIGDITKINGAEVEPVWAIIGGSPCQDLSVAGKRAGLAGARSGLFMEQIRIVKEMRDADKLRNKWLPNTKNWGGGSTNIESGTAGMRCANQFIRPRYMVWENVPGAFSSNKGEDFRAVLEETARIADGNADVPQPPNGKWANAGCIMGNGWSIAWRVHDAQFWGVPQRRRRISLVADFGGQSAPEILFERKSVSGDIAESGTAGERTAGDAERGFGETECFNQLSQSAVYKKDDVSVSLTCCGGSYGGGSECLVSTPTYCLQGNCIDRADTADAERSTDTTIGVKCLNPSFPQSARVYDADGVWHSLNANENGGQSRDAVLCYGICSYASNSMKSDNPHSGIYKADTSRTLDLNGGNPACNQGGVMVLDARDNGDGATAPTLTGDHQNRVTDYTAICVGNGQTNQSVDDKAGALNCMHDQQAIVTYPGVGVTSRQNASNPEPGDPCHTLNTDSRNYVVKNAQSVRRLTPLECERLQGYPDRWTDIPGASDSARYKALGNSIALPFWRWMLNRMSTYLPPDATMGSLFDGIGGFPLIWEEIHGKGSARWASEIEKFPIAVTEYHFGRAYE